MEQASAWFLAEPTSEVTHVQWVDVYQSGRPVLNAVGDPLRLLPTGGSVVYDRNAETRRSLSFEFAAVDHEGTDLIPDPDDPTSRLARGITELRVFMGYRWPRVNPEVGSDVEVVSMGRFRVKSSGAEEDDAGVAVVRGEALDASWLMRQPPRTAYRIRGLTANGDAFRQILHRKDPALEVFTADTGDVLPSGLVVATTASPWAKAEEVALAAGCSGYFDRSGRGVMAPVVTSAAARQVADFIEGEGATFARTKVDADVEDSPNVITIIGTSGGNNERITVTAADTEPGSPTNVDTYGEFTRVIRSPLVGTVGQAQRAAAAMLRRSLAANDRIEFTAGRQPALTEEDTVAITRRNLHLVGRRTVIERIEFPLAEPVMQVSCQRIPTDTSAAA